MAFGRAKVLWREGMVLQPQHLQQAERSILATARGWLNAVWPHAFGIAGIVVDQDALANGLFSITSCRGVLPDGTYFDMPAEDPVPPARVLPESVQACEPGHDVYLALPQVQEGLRSVGDGDTQSGARYRCAAVEIGDEVTGLDRKPVEIGIPRFALRYGDESLDNFSSIRVARLVRTPRGDMTLQAGHIPPLLNIGGSSTLLEEVAGMRQLVAARIAGLSRSRKLDRDGFARFEAGDETAFRLLHALNASAADLLQVCLAPATHPFALYQELMRLAGALCTFSTERSVTDMPRYDHQDLAAALTPLFETIRLVLSAEVSAGCVALDVRKVGPVTYECAVQDRRLFDGGEFYLAASADMSEKELVVSVLQRTKVGSKGGLDTLITSAVPGLQLMHARRPPDGLATKPSYVYFSLGQTGGLWEDIRTDGTMALYFPNEPPGLRMEVLALRNA